MKLEVFILKKYIKKDTLLLKKILSAASDFVCEYNNEIIIKHKYKDVIKLPIMKVDRLGRELPIIKICRKLNSDEFFVAGISNNYSLDSRYFGLISSSVIINTVKHIF